MSTSIKGAFSALDQSRRKQRDAQAETNSHFSRERMSELFDSCGTQEELAQYVVLANYINEAEPAMAAKLLETLQRFKNGMKVTAYTMRDHTFMHVMVPSPGCHDESEKVLEFGVFFICNGPAVLEKQGDNIVVVIPASRHILQVERHRDAKYTVVQGSPSFVLATRKGGAYAGLFSLDKVELPYNSAIFAHVLLAPTDREESLGMYFSNGGFACNDECYYIRGLDAEAVEQKLLTELII